MDKIRVDLGFATLVAERGGDKNYNEIFVWLENKDGICLQDLAIIGQKYHYNDALNVVQDEGINVMVYADENDEDYTHKFDIGIYKPENEEE